MAWPIKGDINVNRRVYAGTAINLPVWTTATDYEVDDLIVDAGVVYLVLTNHTSTTISADVLNSDLKSLECVKETRLQCFEEPGSGLPEGNDVTATYPALGQFQIALANATQDANNLVKVDFLVGGVPVHTMLGGGEYPVLVPAGGGGFPPAPLTLQYVHSSINPNWEAANLVLTAANIPASDAIARITTYGYTAGVGVNEATIVQTSVQDYGIGGAPSLVVNTAGVPSGGTYSVWTYEDGSQRAFNDADNTEFDITGGIPVAWVPCDTDTDTFGEVVVAAATLTTTNGVSVAVGEEYITFPNGTTWANETGLVTTAVDVTSTNLAYAWVENTANTYVTKGTSTAALSFGIDSSTFPDGHVMYLTNDSVDGFDLVVTIDGGAANFINNDPGALATQGSIDVKQGESYIIVKGTGADWEIVKKPVVTALANTEYSDALTSAGGILAIDSEGFAKSYGRIDLTENTTLTPTMSVGEELKLEVREIGFTFDMPNTYIERGTIEDFPVRNHVEVEKVDDGTNRDYLAKIYNELPAEVLVFRHNLTGGGLFTSRLEAETVNENSVNPETLDKYSILTRLEEFRRTDGTLRFRLVYPTLGEDIVFEQTNNFVEDAALNQNGNAVLGFNIISSSSPNVLGDVVSSQFGGITYNDLYVDGTPSFAPYEGNPGHSNWWYPVGQSQAFAGGIPAYQFGGASITTDIIELYIIPE